MDDGILRSLRDPACYEHPVDSFRIIETHISWLILTGRFAYKLKKPVDLGFVDFTDALQRRHYCHEEIRLNRRLAPSLYLDTWAIVGTRDQPELIPDRDPNGPPPGGALDYLVRMKQFDQAGLLDSIQEQGRLSNDHIDELARQVATFHLRQPGETGTDCGDPRSVIRWAIQNFDQAETLVSAGTSIGLLSRLRHWTLDSFDELARRMEERKADGFVRDCHGDLHLGNIALIDDVVTVFDCIEFNRELRVIDVMSEIAFLYMDLLSRREEALAWRFLDRYLAETGDYPGLDLLRFYAVYRAMVRVKVELMQIRGGVAEDPAASRLSAHCRSHLALAERLTAGRSPRLILTRGLSGSGKSRLAGKLLEACGLVRIRSDVERKRLLAAPAATRGPAAVGEGIYSADAGRLTYRHLVEQARGLLAAGYPVIVDATFLQREQRQPFQELAERSGVPFHILDIRADTALLRRRIQRRLAKGRDPSEADVEVLQRQIATEESPVDSEIPYCIPLCGNDGGIDAALPDLVKRFAKPEPGPP